MVNYITVDTNFNETKRRNFYIFQVITAFTWMFFHFAVVFFFMIKLQSVMLIWLFLWFGNLVSFLVDSPIWVLQRYFKAKNLFLTWAWLMLAVGGIFLYFTFGTQQIELGEFSIFSVEAIKWLFSSALNIWLILFSAIAYGVIKELSEVTTNSYIMNNADPSQYADLFSKRNIFYGVGSLVGLIMSWVILAFHPIIAIAIFILIVLFYIFFTGRYFDNSSNEVKEDISTAITEVWDDIKKLKLLTKDDIKQWITHYTTQILDSKIDLKEQTTNLKAIFLKPLELKKSINFWEIIDWTVNDLKSFIKIMLLPPYNYKLLLVAWVFIIFGFWDNFATTFLIDYIDKILIASHDTLTRFHIQDLLTAYVVIWLIWIPAYWAQVPLVALASKIWPWKVMVSWLLISAVSMFLFGFSGTIFFLLIAGLMNGVWYASSLSLSQSEFSSEYNNTYADKNDLKQVDTTASSAPIKMLANLANAVWLMFGGVLIQMLWYTLTFIILWLILLGLFVGSIFFRKRLSLR